MRRVEYHRLAYPGEERNAPGKNRPARGTAALRRAAGASRGADPGSARTRPAGRAAATASGRNDRRPALERLFRMLQPARVGGSELPYRALFELTAVIGRGCGSTAWVL